jgi:hypothetical protein
MAWLGWTSSPVAGSPSDAWFVNFSGGYVDYLNRYNGICFVRLVAGP